MSRNLSSCPVVVLAFLIVPMLSTFAEPACVPDDAELPEAVVMAARAEGVDLIVTLQWHPAADPSIARELVLRDSAGGVVKAQPVLPTDTPFPEEVLPGALQGVGAQGYQLSLAVESDRSAGSEPLPLFPLRRCEEGKLAHCWWSILVGTYSEAVVVSEVLDAALDAQSHLNCNLPAQIAAVRETSPFLGEEVDQMEQQLEHWEAMMGSLECGFYWEAVVLSSQPTVSLMTQTLSVDGSDPDAELASFSGDAGHCQAAQARRLSSGVTHPSTVVNAGYHGVQLGLRCSSGSVACTRRCTGSAALALDYTSCSLSEAITGVPFASGMARSEEEMDLTLDGAVALSSGVEALSYGVPALDSQTFLHLDQGALPLEVLLSTSRELEVAASYGGGITGAEPVDPGGEGFAFTEVANEYTLTVIGQASNGCGLSKPQARVTLASPDYVQATAFGKGRGGSIKIEKW